MGIKIKPNKKVDKKSTRMRILVLYGGPSDEREVSIKSGLNVIKNLDKNRYKVEKLLVPKTLNLFFTDINKKRIRQADVIFIAMHGYFGEDGALQSYLESLSVKYTFSGVYSSATSINKYLSTLVAKSVGINTPKSYLITREFNQQTVLEEIIRTGFPLVLKPNSGGSSDGVTMANNIKEFQIKLNDILKNSRDVIAQELISGREFTCGVLGNYDGKLTPLPPVEIMREKIFDKKMKYSKNTIEICPPKISNQLKKKLMALSSRIHIALGCRGVSRSDFILKNGRFYYLETNSIPGLTQTSLILKELKAHDIPFPIFLEKVIDLA